MADKIRVLLTEEEVDRRINEVAEEINRDSVVYFALE